MPYREPISVDEVKAKLAYDPATGIITWLVAPAKNIRAGAEAGCVKATRNNGPKYRYIKLRYEVIATRIAWVLHYGEWPKNKLDFADGDTLNLKISNLIEMNSLDEKFGDKSEYLREHRKKFPKVWKNTHLQRSFGIGLAEYSQMVADRDNKCDICGQPETQMRGGKVKALAVDHDHATGAIRGLLCSDCNQAIGKLKDSPTLLAAAIQYLDNHRTSGKIAPLSQGETP